MAEHNPPEWPTLSCTWDPRTHLDHATFSVLLLMSNNKNIKKWENNFSEQIVKSGIWEGVWIFAYPNRQFSEGLLIWNCLILHSSWGLLVFNSNEPQTVFSAVPFCLSHLSLHWIFKIPSKMVLCSPFSMFFLQKFPIFCIETKKGRLYPAKSWKLHCWRFHCLSGKHIPWEFFFS